MRIDFQAALTGIKTFLLQYYALKVKYQKKERFEFRGKENLEVFIRVPWDNCRITLSLVKFVLFYIGFLKCG